MVFVRIKRISGKEYGYLVANSWTGSGPRQKVSEYLGKVRRPVKAKSEDLRAFLGLTSEQEMREWVAKSSFREIAASLIKLELKNHGINEGSGLKIDAEKAEFKDEKGKKTVLAMNDGFLCSYTAQRLLNYDAAADYSGYDLADALTAAGIAVEKDIFISLFGKMQQNLFTEKGSSKNKKETPEEAAFKDFYY